MLKSKSRLVLSAAALLSVAVLSALELVTLHKLRNERAQNEELFDVMLELLKKEHDNKLEAERAFVACKALVYKQNPTWWRPQDGVY